MNDKKSLKRKPERERNALQQQKWAVKVPKIDYSRSLEDVVDDDSSNDVDEKENPRETNFKFSLEPDEIKDNEKKSEVIDDQSNDELDVDLSHYLEVMLDISDPSPAAPPAITEVSQDPAKWPQRLSENKIDQIISLGPLHFQNKQVCLLESGKIICGRQYKVSENAFYQTLENGKVQEREWLLYSPTDGNLYCLYCKLFAGKTTSNLATKGLSAFMHLMERLKDHENAKEHKNTVRVYSDRAKAGCSLATMLSKLVPAAREKKVLKFSQDLGEWPPNPNESQINRLVSVGYKYYQNKQACLQQASEKENPGKQLKLLEEAFILRCKNGDIVERQWLCYSPSTGNLYCFPCKLFTADLPHNQFVPNDELLDCLRAHELSPDHFRSVYTSSTRKNAQTKTVAALPVPAPVDPTVYWTDILRRTVAEIKFNSEIGSADFHRDSLELLPHDAFMAMINLLQDNGTVLRAHTKKYGAQAVNEFIRKMADAVRNKIIAEIKQSHYFSIVLDCTPEVTLEDHLSLVVRYVLNDVIRERLLDTLEIYGATRGPLADAILERLRSYGLDFKNCRGISNDNTKHLTWYYNLVADGVKGDSPTAIFSPVAAHSLNLVLENDANCVYSGKLFKITKTVEDFISASMHRLTVFNTKTENPSNTDEVLSNIGETRTSHRHIALQNLQENFETVCQTAIEITDGVEEFFRSRFDAKRLLEQLLQIQTTLPLVVWRTVLTSVRHVNKYLQQPGLNLFEACSLLKSLPDRLQAIKKDFGKFEEEAEELFSDIDQSYADSDEPESEFNSESFLMIIDRMITGINELWSQYSEVCDRFGFLTNFMNDTSVDTILLACCSLIDTYPDDLRADLTIEMLEYVAEHVENIADKTVDNLFQKFVESSLQNKFPNVYVCFKIFLCLPITNRERTFRMMAIVKDKYDDLSVEKTVPPLQLLSVENEMVNTIDFESMIESFAAKAAATVKPITVTTQKD